MRFTHRLKGHREEKADPCSNYRISARDDLFVANASGQKVYILCIAFEPVFMSPLAEAPLMCWAVFTDITEGKSIQSLKALWVV